MTFKHDQRKKYICFFLNTHCFIKSRITKMLNQIFNQNGVKNVLMKGSVTKSLEGYFLKKTYIFRIKKNYIFMIYLSWRCLKLQKVQFIKNFALFAIFYQIFDIFQCFETRFCIQNKHMVEFLIRLLIYSETNHSSRSFV